MLRSAQLKPFRRTQTKWNKVKAKAILGDIEFKAKAILGDVTLHNSNFLSTKNSAFCGNYLSSLPAEQVSLLAAK